MSELIIALEEEIGDPGFFVGREAELSFLLEWTERSKLKRAKSRAILARRKRGKTALVQRLFNILYSNNDPRVVPFFFRVKEDLMFIGDFGELFYRNLMSQLLGFQERDPNLINDVLSIGFLKKQARHDPVLLQDIEIMQELLDTNPALVWHHARDAPHRIASKKDIRIIQIIDEFQYMNRFLYADKGLEKQINVCHSYMAAAESKVAPLIVTGSYIGWLDAILTYMTSRFDKEQLQALTDAEALETVYNYATRMDVPIREATAPYIATVAHNDPFYISQIIQTRQPGRDLTTEQGVRDALIFETTPEKGFIASVWLEYILDAFGRLNEVNAKRMVLYLAKYGDQERSRKQIREDLQLSEELTDDALELRLHKLRMADLIARGSSLSRYKGLGDPVFEMVFRRAYGEEIDDVDLEQITQDSHRALTHLKRKTAWLKGIRGEYKVRYHLTRAAQKGIALADVVHNPSKGLRLDPYASTKKERISATTETSREVDIYARALEPDGCDLVIEVKNWEKQATHKEIEAFLQLKAMAEQRVTKKTGYLFYSENGFDQDGQATLNAAGVMYTDSPKLTSYEAGLDTCGQD